jgi:uncharacterized membrane-anchored protein
MIILVAAVFVLAAVNHSIHAKEQIIRHGETIYLALAPVDPRSLMQGDYMALRFQLAADIERSLSASRIAAAPRVWVILDDRRIARPATDDAARDLGIRYRVRDGRVWLGTNAYFFEEGTASRFDRARFGEFKVDRGTGEAVLVALRDEELRAL